MEAQVVRFSRPLLIETSHYQDDSPFFQTVYGFRIQDRLTPVDPIKLDDYVGYLCGLHCVVSDGDDFFTISYDERGLPDSMVLDLVVSNHPVFHIYFIPLQSDEVTHP